MNNDILNSFCRVCKEFVGNSNSLHKLGLNSKKLEDAASKQIIDVLRLTNKEIIYTSGRYEANNLLVFGLLSKYIGKNKRIFVSSEVDSSIKCSLEVLSKYFVIDYIDCSNGSVDINQFKFLYSSDTVLVSLNYVKNYEEILKFINCYSHIDISNCHCDIKLDRFDFVTIEDNDLLGFGCLIKNKNIVLEPILHGGKSTTIYRSGTPALPFIVSFSKLVKNKYNI